MNSTEKGETWASQGKYFSYADFGKLGNKI